MEKTSEQRSAAEKLGQAIRIRRAELNMKRRELAVESGLSYPYVSEIENGQKEPSSKALRQLATALGLNSTDLLRWMDLSSPSEGEPIAGHTEELLPFRFETASWAPPVPDRQRSATQNRSAPSSASIEELRVLIADEVARQVQQELQRWATTELPIIVATAIEASRLRDDRRE